MKLVIMMNLIIVVIRTLKLYFNQNKNTFKEELIDYINHIFFSHFILFVIILLIFLF